MSSRSVKRQEEADAIRDQYPHVPVQWLPSPAQHRSWEPWVCWADGADDQGTFLGFCPFHDGDKKIEGSGEFNFFKGILRCNGEPRCTTNRAMSLVNVAARMASVND